MLLAHVALGIAVALGLSATMAEDADVWVAAIVGFAVVIVLISATLRRLSLRRRAVPTAGEEAET